MIPQKDQVTVQQKLNLMGLAVGSRSVNNLNMILFSCISFSSEITELPMWYNMQLGYMGFFFFREMLVSVRIWSREYFAIM